MTSVGLQGSVTIPVSGACIPTVVTKSKIVNSLWAGTGPTVVGGVVNE